MKNKGIILFSGAILAFIMLLGCTSKNLTKPENINAQEPVITQFTADMMPENSASYSLNEDWFENLSEFVVDVNDQGTVAGNFLLKDESTETYYINSYIYNAADGLQILENPDKKHTIINSLGSDGTSIGAIIPTQSTGYSFAYFKKRKLFAIPHEISELSYVYYLPFITANSLYLTVLGITTTDNNIIYNIAQNTNIKYPQIRNIMALSDNGSVIGYDYSNQIVICNNPNQCSTIAPFKDDNYKYWATYTAQFKISPDGNFIYGIRANLHNGFKEIFIYNAKQHQFNVISSRGYDIYSKKVGNNGTLLVRSNTETYIYLPSIDKFYSSSKLLNKLGITPYDTITNITMSPNAKYLIYSVKSDNSYNNKNQVNFTEIYFPGGIEDYLEKKVSPTDIRSIESSNK